MPKSATRGIPVVLLAAVTSAVSEVLAIPESFNRHTISIIGSAGVASGAIVIESAQTPDYAGTWNPVMGGVDVEAAATVEVNFNGLYRFLRVSTDPTIADGTVTVHYTGSL